MGNIVKLVLAILLFLCLVDMPYGFYQFVRFSAMIGFGILAYQAREQGKQVDMIVFGSLALLFQPLIKIALGRDMWNLVDIIVGVYLLFSVINNKKKIFKG